MFELKDQMFFPIPLLELSKKMKGKHLNMRPVVDALIADYIRANGKGFLKLNQLLMKMMEGVEDLYSFTKEDEKELEKELKELDVRFKPVMDTIKELAWSEQKNLFVDNFNNLSLLMRKMKDSMHEKLLKKEEPEEMDFGMYSYLLYFTAVLEVLTDLLAESNKDEFERKLAIANLTAVLYGTLITSYYQGNLKIELLRERLGDLTIFTEPVYRKTSRKVRDVLKQVADVAPMS